MLKTLGNTAYSDLAEEGACLLKRSYEDPKISGPKVIADAILKAITARSPKTRYVVGYMARTYLFFRRILPDKMFDKLLFSAMK